MDELSAAAARVWAGGRYERIARLLEPAAEVLCDAAGAAPGVRLLDVGAGTGNVALAAARRGAEVVAGDVAPAMVAAGRTRTDGLAVTWEEHDARALPHPDGAFDVAVSCFAAIFVPEPERVGRELRRVAGRVAVTAWTRDGAQGAAFALLGRHLAGSPSRPFEWGTPEGARRFLGADVQVHGRELTWRFRGGLEGFVSHFEDDAPPVAAARAALGPDRWPEVRRQLRDVIAPFGREEPDGTYAVPTGYLLITG